MLGSSFPHRLLFPRYRALLCPFRYNVKEETYVTDSEAALLEYKCPNSGQPLKRVEEASYFFRMSKYHNQLLQHIQTNSNFILPDAHRNQIINRLESDALRDLSISRTTFSWGIPVPKGFDEKHVIYVWLDGTFTTNTGRRDGKLFSKSKHPVKENGDFVEETHARAPFHLLFCFCSSDQLFDGCKRPWRERQ